MHSPVPDTARVATKDDELPVAKPYKDANGIIQDSIRYVRSWLDTYPVSIGPLLYRISEGDSIIISIQAINVSPELWGPDADEFKYVIFVVWFTALTHS